MPPTCVMAGLVPAIHAGPQQSRRKQWPLPGRVDARDKHGHDGWRGAKDLLNGLVR
jgi:hypothetical protein